MPEWRAYDTMARRRWQLVLDRSPPVAHNVPTQPETPMLNVARESLIGVGIGLLIATMFFAAVWVAL